MKVAILRFEKIDCDQTEFASMPFGKYEIFMGRSSWCAELQFGNHCIILSREIGITKEEAIKICQEDFEQRVLACIVEENSGNSQLLKVGE
ncbi:hypothetical protein HC752_21790 [Vibrio sp. S9_S30]|uniref:hypothetical protein n=1 Tax=Vibrio sp. S9_S30 TaxID=2720226 RepID=UPI0016803D29|nr:hypothetical protein [Vibrio sp. S9_S30]MBD1559579.1 hypothetical protein [Vibrio sp. S9_S30]